MIWAWLPKLRTLPRSLALKRSNPIHEPCRSPGAMLSPQQRGGPKPVSPPTLSTASTQSRHTRSSSIPWADRPLSLETQSVIPAVHCAGTTAALEICRYRPLELRSLLSGRENWLVSEFVEASPLQFIDAIASEITGHEMLEPNVRPPS